MSDAPLNPDELEVAPGFQHEMLQGFVPSMATPDEIRDALEKAFDYRGDVTVIRRDGSKVDGYLFDRQSGASLETSRIRLLPLDGTPRQTILYSDVAGLVFSQRDPAAGKSWEAWIKKYWEKKATGEAAAIEPEELA